MGFLLQTLYSQVFKFFCLPVFIIMLIGRPRFLITWIHKFINLKEPFLKVKLFRGLFSVCLLTVLYSYYRKWSLENLVQEITKSQRQGEVIGNINFLDEKLREAHLFERNAYMFFTFMILMIVVEKFCHSYFKLWNLEDEVKAAKSKELSREPVKDTIMKKNE
jgi:hypothetical protein